MVIGEIEKNTKSESPFLRGQASKSEIRISKFETNSNDRNTKLKRQKIEDRRQRTENREQKTGGKRIKKLAAKRHEEKLTAENAEGAESYGLRVEEKSEIRSTPAFAGANSSP